MSAAMPSDETLLQWLDHAPARLEEYLDTDPEGYDRLDRLTALPVTVVERLSDALTVPDGLALRINAAVSGNPERRDAVRTLLDGLRSTWAVGGLLWNDGEDD